VRNLLSLARAFVVRDCLTEITYKATLAIEAVDVIVAVAAFYYLSRIVGDRHPAGYDAFAFLLVGLAANSAMSTALTCFAQAVKADQQTGAIKPVLMSPLPAAGIVALGSIYPMARSTLSVGAYLAAGLFFGLVYRVSNILLLATVVVASLAAFAAIGMLSAASTLVFKRGDPLLWLFASLSWLLGGVFFPVSLLPRMLQRMSALLPIRYAVNALRAALLGGASFTDVQSDLIVLVAIAVLGLPLSAWLVHAGTMRVKRNGTLEHC
jgi:ABC-2 type transport system permease protein